MRCYSHGSGLYVAAETHKIAWHRRTQPGARAVLSLQGSHSRAAAMVDEAQDHPRTRALVDAGFVVAAGDLAQTATQGTFGNVTVEQRVGQLRTFVQGASSPLRASGKVHLIGVSGGATAAINFARANPGLVASMYLMTPVVDLEDFYTRLPTGGITQAEVDAAYGGSAARQAAMPARNPSRPGNQDALAAIPVRCAYSTSDPFIPVGTVTAWVDAVNDAGGSADAYSLGAVIHNAASVNPGDVARFFRDHT